MTLPRISYEYWRTPSGSIQQLDHGREKGTVLGFVYIPYPFRDHIDPGRLFAVTLPDLKTGDPGRPILVPCDVSKITLEDSTHG